MNKFIPEEILVEILSKLPIKSLFRFKCVSKTWLSLIYKSYPNLSRPQPVAVVKYTLVDHRGDEMPGQVQLLGCSNGLLLLNKRATDFILFDPKTGYCKQITSQILEVYRWGHMYGLCYDQIKDDYLVILGISDDNNRYTNRITGAHVFWLKETRRKDILFGRNYYSTALKNSGLVCNGHLHWVVKTTSEPYDDVLLYFDPLKEENGFTELVLPDMASPRERIKGCGVLWDSILSLTIMDTKSWNFRVMAMQENSSWSTMFVVPSNINENLFFKVPSNIYENLFFKERITPLCVSNEGEFIMFLHRRMRLASYCPRKRSSRIIGDLATGAVTLLESVFKPQVLSAQDKDAFIDKDIKLFVSLISDFGPLSSYCKM